MASFGSTAYSTTSMRVRTGCGLQEQPIRRPECCLVCKATCPGGPSRSSRGRIPSKELWGPEFAIGDTARKGDMAKVAGHYATMCARCGSTVSLLRPQCSLGYDDCCKSKATARWRHIAVDASQTSESRNTQALFKLFASTSSLVPDGGGCQWVESRLIVQAGSGPMSCCPGPYSSRLPSLSPSRKAAGLREMQETSGFRSWFSSTRMPRLGH